MKGYLRRWKSTRMPLLLALFIDILTIPSILSLTFQKETIDPVQSVRALKKAKDRLVQFEKRHLKNYQTLETFSQKSRQ